MINFWNGFEKMAKEDKDPGWWDKQKGMARAMRKSDSGVGQIIADPELIKKRVSEGGRSAGKGALGAGATGAAIGGLARRGKGALIGGGLGALLGGTGGFDYGVHKANKAHLGSKGIKLKNMGFSSEFSPEAEKKYIADYKKKK